jgi:hypothetical protein
VRFLTFMPSGGANGAAKVDFAMSASADTGLHLFLCLSNF